MENNGKTALRQSILDAMEKRPGGMLLTEILAEVGGVKVSVKSALCRGKEAGVFALIGKRNQALWGLPPKLADMERRLANIRRAALQRQRKRNRGYMAVTRSCKPKRKVQRGREWAIPAVNSVWSLAA